MIFAIYKLNIFIRNKKTTIPTHENEVSKSFLDIFNEFDEDTQKVFGYIMYCQEKNIRCTKQSINRNFRDENIFTFAAALFIHIGKPSPAKRIDSHAFWRPGH